MNTRGRRKHLRCAVRIPVKVRVEDKKKRKIWSGSGNIANIGGGGVRLDLVGINKEIVQKLVGKEYVFRLTFSLPEFWMRLRMTAEVSWVKTAEESGVSKQQFGMAFKNIPRNKGQRIVKYVEGRTINELVDRAFQRAIEDFKKKTGKTKQ